jgi:hypothetical protein
MPAHGTTYINRPFEPQSPTELNVEIEKKALVQLVFFLPPLDRLGGQTLAMIRKVEDYDPVQRRHFTIVKEMTPLTTV